VQADVNAGKTGVTFMNTESHPSQQCGPQADSRKATARLIATFGGSRILRHRDGSLDGASTTTAERAAALAWICAVSPDLARRVRRCPAPAV
jgi:hypothetical protein